MSNKVEWTAGSLRKNENENTKNKRKNKPKFTTVAQDTIHTLQQQQQSDEFPWLKCASCHHIS